MCQRGYSECLKSGSLMNQIASDVHKTMAYLVPKHLTPSSNSLKRGILFLALLYVPNKKTTTKTCFPEFSGF